jgi:aryl sulfotransferase
MLNKEVKPIWLASYPKSGNTWTSLFLSVLITDNELNINRPGFENIISSRKIIDSTLGISSSDLPEEDFLKYRSSLYHKWASVFKNREYLLVKVHDACILADEILFPVDITRGVIYIMRNPFDMAASLANHTQTSVDEAVKCLCRDTYALADKNSGLNTQLSQHLGTWSNHVNSWTSVHSNNMLVVKYEDLVEDAISGFSKIVEYLGLDYTKQAIEAAIAKTSFQNLQEQEKKVKFNAAPNIDRFFRLGKVGNWRNELTKEQVDLIRNCNYDTLLKYNYIDANGDILV